MTKFHRIRVKKYSQTPFTYIASYLTFLVSQLILLSYMLETPAIVIYKKIKLNDQVFQL